MNIKYSSQNNEPESEANRENQSFSKGNSAGITIEELIEDIRDKIQEKLMENAKSSGPQK